MSTTTLEKSQTLSRNNMSKLERLNARVSKLLTVAVHEVLEVVRDTVSEYQEKTARTQRENERLRLKLRDALEQLEKEKEVSRLASISLLKNSSSTQPQQPPPSDVSPLRQEPMPTQTEDKAIKGEDLANAVDAETVCDLRVALTLADVCTSEAEHDNETQHSVHASDPSPADCNPSIAVVDIKTESVSMEDSSSQQQMPQAGFEDIAENLHDPVPREVLTGTSSYGSVFVQSNFSTAGRCVMTGRSSKSTAERSRSFQGPRSVENHGCKVCGKTFSRVGNLRIHERCHTGEKPYCCQVCGRCFIQAGDLKKHRRVHTGEKPYYCLQCGKSFSRRENLKRHQKIHIGESLHPQRIWKDPQ